MTKQASNSVRSRKPLPAALAKVCPTCGPLPRSEFYRNKARPDGLQSSCKSCHLAAVGRYRVTQGPALLATRRARYWADPDTARDNAKVWARENRNACRQSEERYRAAKPWKHRCKAATRRARITHAPELYVESHRPMITGCFTRNIEDVYAVADLMTKLLNEPYEVDHALALADGGAHHKDNLDVLSLTENRRKGCRMRHSSPGKYAV